MASHFVFFSRVLFSKVIVQGRLWPISFVANYTINFFIFLSLTFTRLCILYFGLSHKWFNYFLLFFSICFHNWKCCSIRLSDNIIKSKSFCIAIEILFRKAFRGLFLYWFISRFLIYLRLFVIVVSIVHRLYSMLISHMTIETIILWKCPFTYQAKRLIFIAFPDKINITIFLLSLSFSLFFSLLYLFSS